MTEEQVIASEGVRPSGTFETGKEISLRFDSAKNPDLAGTLFYIFDAHGLVRAQYISAAAHAELNDFIADFDKLEPVLTDKYDRPIADRTIWLNDEYQLERLPYLEQDRAHATDILPSDVNAGLSVAMGHLKMFTERRRGNTRIIHSLTGEESKITHLIEYRGVEDSTPGRPSVP